MRTPLNSPRGGREVVGAGGHSLGEGDELTLDAGEVLVESLAKRRLGGKGRGGDYQSQKRCVFHRDANFSFSIVGASAITAQAVAADEIH